MENRINRGKYAIIVVLCRMWSSFMTFSDEKPNDKPTTIIQFKSQSRWFTTQTMDIIKYRLLEVSVYRVGPVC